MDPREGVQGERFSSYMKSSLAACRDFFGFLGSFVVVFFVDFLGSFLGRFGVSFWGVFWSRWALFLLFFCLFFLCSVFRNPNGTARFWSHVFGFVEPKTASKSALFSVRFLYRFLVVF